ncbi:MAG: glycerophosphoryl diester phosphodiesterase membrane domain-containing protein [Fuerstiella sp.]|nr:glycerophosphoryl diester phosphodiesterase membrane domain-containing protein [Fuerstiella sp.]
METVDQSNSIVGSWLTCFFGRWNLMLATDVVYKMVAFVLLTPLVAALFRLFLALSGQTVLADLDILLFFLSPAGWICLITVGVLWAAIAAMELAVLLAVLAADEYRHVRVRDAILFAFVNAWRMSVVIVRMLGTSLLIVTPLLAAGALTFRMLLTDYDINFYLHQKPPAFLAAAGIGAVLVVVLVLMGLRMMTNWMFALPIVLFEHVSPIQALRVSRERAAGQRLKLTFWISLWGIAVALISAMAHGAVLWLGELVVPSAASSLPLLTIAVGVSLAVWAVVQLLLNLVLITTFASLHWSLYQSCGSVADANTRPFRISEKRNTGGRFRVTRRRLQWLSGLGCLAAVGIGVLALYNVSTDRDVRIVAHRGSSKVAPENTMAAVRQAIADGADWIEIDVQEISDGPVVVFHDSDFMKLAGQGLKIWDATSDDVRSIDIGSWMDAAFSDQRVPTLAAVLEECRGQVGVLIELKYYGHDQQLEQRVVEAVESAGMTDHVMLMSLSVNAVKKVKSLRPNWKVGLLLSVAAGDMSKLDVDFLAVNAEFVTHGGVTAAHKHAREIYAWTVNDAVTMSTLIGRGVDGIITDRPDLGRTVLAHRAQASVPERLLLELAETLGVVPDIADQ